MENRTPDLRIANAALYQLSYDPDREPFYHRGRAGWQGQSHQRPKRYSRPRSLK